MLQRQEKIFNQKNEELGKMKTLKTIILDIAKKGGYDMVLTNNNVTWLNQTLLLILQKKLLKQ